VSADLLSPALAYLAGALTILSPCVLPLVPVVLSSAARGSRFGPLALAAGLIASFTVTGFAVATLGAASGLDGEPVRMVGAGLLALVGLILLIPAIQNAISRLSAPLSNWASQRQAGLDRFGLLGQAAIGVLLGLVWSPCVGPTLGAATVLAAQGQNLTQVAAVMAAFGFGIGTVLLVLAFMTKGLLARWRGRLVGGGQRGKRLLGGILLMIGILILTGADRLIEGLLVSVSPDWLVDLTTRY
jgi:cytochrome c-type biogenesis protein